MKPIFGPGAKLRGFLRESRNRIEVLGPTLRLLAIYYVDQNITVATGGRLIGFGNQLMFVLGQQSPEQH